MQHKTTYLLAYNEICPIFGVVSNYYKALSEIIQNLFYSLLDIYKEKLRKWPYFAHLISINILVLLVLSKSYATGIEFPPYFNLSNPAEMEDFEDFVKQVQKLTFNRGYVDIGMVRTLLTQQNKLINNFTKDKEYMEWAAQKKEPVRIEVLEKQSGQDTWVFSEEAISSIRSDLTPTQTTSLNQWNSFLQETDHLGGETLLHIYSYWSDEIFNRSNLNGAQELIVGISSALTANEKGQVFQSGSLENQRNLIHDLTRNSESFDESLGSSFSAERFGYHEEVISREFLLHQLDSLIELESRAFSLMVLLQILDNSTEISLSDITTDLIEQVVIQLSSSNKILEKLVDSISEQIEDKGLKRNQVLQRLKKIKSAGLKKVTLEKKVNNPETLFYIQEVPPFLGICRGWVGGDCSTNSSWSYPYIPTEHVFYIMHTNGRALGYITTTDVTVNGKKTVYLKDLSGKHLSGSNAELALHAMFLAREYFDAELFTIASYRFISVENHISAIKKMFYRYNGNEDIISQDLSDEKMRSRMARYSSSSSYDSPYYHAEANTFKPNDKILNSIEIKLSTGEFEFLPAPKLLSLQEEMWEVLKNKLLDSQRRTVSNRLRGKQRKKIQEFTDILDNKNRWNLEDYYSHTGNLLREEFDIDLSNKFIKKHTYLFMRGHLFAADAFTTPNDSLLNQSERFLDQALAGEGYEWISEVILENPDIISGLPRIEKRLKRYANHNKQTLRKVYFLSLSGLPLAWELLRNAEFDLIEIIKEELDASLKELETPPTFLTEGELSEIKEIINPTRSIPIDEYINSIMNLFVHKLGLSIDDLHSVGVSEGVINHIVKEGVLEKLIFFRRPFFDQILTPYLSHVFNGERESSYESEKDIITKIVSLYAKNGNLSEKSSLAKLIIKRVEAQEVPPDYILSSISELWYVGGVPVARNYILSLDYEALRKHSQDSLTDSYKRGIIILLWTFYQIHISTSPQLHFNPLELLNKTRGWRKFRELLKPQFWIEEALWALDANKSGIEGENGDLLSRLAIEVIVNYYEPLSVTKETRSRVTQELFMSAKYEDDPYIKVLASYKLLELKEINLTKKIERLQKIIRKYIDEANLHIYLRRKVELIVPEELKEGSPCNIVLGKIAS